MNAEKQARLEKVVMKRLAKAQDQIDYSLDKIRKGRPLDAETDKNRKIARIACVAQVPKGEAKRMLQAGPTAESDSRALLAESIQGGSIDFDPIVFIEDARIAANAVVLVEGPEIGSGFMISPELMITNNHVIDGREAAAHTTITFTFEDDRKLRRRPITKFRLDPGRFFATSEIEDLDYSVVAVGDKLEGPLELSQCGYCRLTEAGDKHTIGERANIIEHPEARPKQIVIRENRILARPEDEGVLLYESDTLGGSSGSPVFNHEWSVIALHHWGGPHRALLGGAQVPQTVNEGIRISAIVKDLRARRASLPESMQAMLDRALNLPSIFDEESIPPLVKADPPSPNGHAKMPSVLPSPSKEQAMPDIQEFKFTIPIEITVRVPSLGGGDVRTPPVSPLPGKSEGVHIDPNFSNRNGYEPDFLPGWVIPFPTLKDDDLGSPARLLQPSAGNPHELKYQNFSIVMNARRKMAYFTACNIDGAKLVHLARDGSGEAMGSFGDAEAAEAGDRWFDDERIARSDRHGQELYSNQRPAHLFDRGHQVRRLDPVWGENAVRANADTFHFTNSCPQAAPFNQGQRFWQGIENFVLNNAGEERLKISVFTGPIFEDRSDFMFRELLVPAAFYKIVARVEGGQRLVTAFIADQSQFLHSMPEALAGRRESFDDTSKVKEFLSTVAEIERRTHIDFGPLRNFDTASGGEGMRLLRSESDLREALKTPTLR